MKKVQPIGRGETILVVDDNEDNRDMYAQGLTASASASRPRATDGTASKRRRACIRTRS